MLADRVRISVTKEPFNPELYNYGANEDKWIEYFDEENSSPGRSMEFSKESDHLLMYDTSDNLMGFLYGAYVYDDLVDLTEYTTVSCQVVIENRESSSWLNVNGALNISDIKFGNDNEYIGDYHAYFDSSGTYSVDVSDLSGEYYIRVHLYAGFYNTGAIKYYRVWLS